MTSTTTDRTTQRGGAPSSGRRTPLRLGFVPLIDAAPLVAAAELGYFADEGLAVSLERQIGWGNVRDKLTFGQLDASHALVGMPAASRLGWESFSEPLVSLMTLATGGNGITLSKTLADHGVTTATALHDWVRSRQGGERPVRLAHVFGCSAHHYLLRMWLESGGIDPDRDVTLRVVPPPQMGWQLAEGCIDGFCSGEPWNTIAQQKGSGTIVAATTDLLPAHPEKVLAVTRRWAADHGDVAERLVRAVVRGCTYCHDRRNAGELAKFLSKKAYLDLPPELIDNALAFAGPRPTHAKPATASCFDPAGTFPSATHAAWVLGRMARVAGAPPTGDPLVTARRCSDPAPYRRAARTLGIPCPPDDFPAMPLRTGTYDPLAQRRTQRAVPA